MSILFICVHHFLISPVWKQQHKEYRKKESQGRNIQRSGFTELVSKLHINNRVKDFETKHSEPFCTGFIICKRMGMHLFLQTSLVHKLSV